MDAETKIQIARIGSTPAVSPVRQMLWEREGKKCHWCHQPTRLHPFKADGSYDANAWDKATVDHVIPRSKEGTNDLSNLVSACNLCNNRRGHEDQCGLPDGSMLGKYDPSKGMTYKGPKRRVALSGDDKKAIMAGKLPPTVKHSAEDILRIQRDQALRQVMLLRKDKEILRQTITAQETTIKQLQFQISEFSVWRLLRIRIAEWIRPK